MPTEAGASNPILAIVEGDAGARVALERVITRRFGGDYTIATAASGEEALAWLSATRGEVALVLASQWLPGITGIELLARVRELHAEARRVLLISFGDARAAAPILEAMTFGHIDAFETKDWASPEEKLYPTIAEALSEWTRANRPRFESVQIVGQEWSPREHEMRDLLERSGIPCGLHAATSDVGQRLLRDAGCDAGRLPVVFLPSGQVSVDPTIDEIARALGARTEPPRDAYDLAVIGSGPAGLGAAVYGASEGLRTIVIEPRAIGGQAGTSALIRNYLGFSRGVSGGKLMVRAYQQAWLFGVDFVFAREVTGIESRGAERLMTLTGIDRASETVTAIARAVVIASGVSYERLGIAPLEALSGAGVFYGAATSEAAAMRGRRVFVAGGGNSAAQAALHLARFAAEVTLVVRGACLAAGVSEYLLGEISRKANITVRLRTRIVDGGGTRHLERLVLADDATCARVDVPADALFLLIGARPHTDWMAPHLARDARGFVLTGRDLPAGAWRSPRPPLANETSLPGVFAAGDVRHGSVRRVAAAVGDGASTIAQVHEYLSAG